MIEKDFIKYITEQIVENPKDVRIERVTDESGVLLKLWVNKSDLGRIIGSHGDTAVALRTLLRALGTKNSEHYYLKIINTDEIDASIESKNDNKSAVENNSSENVENTDDRLKNLKKGIAEINDLDI